MAKILTFTTAVWNGNSLASPQPPALLPKRSADTDGYRAKDIWGLHFSQVEHYK